MGIWRQTSPSVVCVKHEGSRLNLWDLFHFSFFLGVARTHTTGIDWRLQCKPRWWPHNKYGMIPPWTASACAAAGTALIGVFTFMDCSPSLFLAHQWGQRRTIDKRRIWIIGASDGIGKELALQLAKNHEAKQIILSSRSRDKLIDIQHEIVSSLDSTCNVSILPMDVCDASSIDTAFEILAKDERIIDTVVFNAGAGSLGLVEESDPKDVGQLMQVNAIWPMIVAPRLLRDSRLFPSPHFVVTASVASVMPVPLSASYAAAKHALLGYFRTVLAELPSSRIHTFLPGPIDTNFHSSTGSSSSKLKQGKERCVELMRTGMKFKQSREFYIARQPLLFLLYLNQLCPSLLMSLVYQRVGPKRRSLWKRGLDLYDPNSWRS